MKSSHYGYTYRPSNLQSKRDVEVVEPLTDADREYLTELHGISGMGNGRLLDAFQNAHGQGAAQYDELLRRLGGDK